MLTIQNRSFNSILNNDYKLPKTAGLHVLFCPETRFTRYSKYLADLLNTYPLNPKLDYYTSYNTFSKRGHTDADILGLNALWLDFDCDNNNLSTHLFNYAIPQLLDLMQLPKPNHVVMSGHGFHFVWFFSQARFTHSQRFTAFWSKLEKKIIKLGQDACAELFDNSNICDSSVSNPSRLMRITGSYNNKHRQHILVRRLPKFETSEKNDFTFFVNNYLPTLSQSITRHPLHKKFRKFTHTNKQIKTKNAGVVNWSRYYDLKHLVKMRDGNVKGLRDLILFYAECQLYHVTTKARTKACIQSINNLFLEPLPKEQIKDLINEMDTSKFKTYKLHTNSYLITCLKITIREQKNLITIKSSVKSTKHKHHDAHIQRTIQIRKRNYWIIKYHKQGKSIRVIAKKLKVGKSTVDRVIHKVSHSCPTVRARGLLIQKSRVNSDKNSNLGLNFNDMFDNNNS